MEIIENAEVAWANGPLRKLGTGNGKASRYVCSKCRYQVNGVYRVKRGSSAVEIWVCSDCRSELQPKRAQPAGLRRARRK